MIFGPNANEQHAAYIVDSLKLASPVTFFSQFLLVFCRALYRIYRELAACSRGFLSSERLLDGDFLKQLTLNYGPSVSLPCHSGLQENP